MAGAEYVQQVTVWRNEHAHAVTSRRLCGMDCVQSIGRYAHTHTHLKSPKGNQKNGVVGIRTETETENVYAPNVCVSHADTMVNALDKQMAVEEIECDNFTGKKRRDQ